MKNNSKKLNYNDFKYFYISGEKVYSAKSYKSKTGIEVIIDKFHMIIKIVGNKPVKLSTINITNIIQSI